ncbi:MBL fold metallo-hydrolase [Alistipes sp. ZOR0009]|uniref:MBL fold metallo-hydrolase n=1 Tax=Alistipes sp. ZOR0009 TaxID=1339253 RepID=UPI000645C0E2|nr:MBL fold metallo-hydrolase [Alistipes sp. ZOR0009]
MAVKITTLVENTSFQSELKAEHGLAFHIEANGTSILFDAGQSDLLLHNAKKLGIDLMHVDVVVISHGHYDHIGGLSAFLDMNKRAKVFVKRAIFDKKYRGTSRYVGSDMDIRDLGDRLHFVDQVEEVADGVYVIPDIPIVDTKETHMSGFTVKHNDQFAQDWFEDELFLAIATSSGMALVSCCSHRGITNMIQAAQKRFGKPVRVVLGGFHLLNAGDEEVDRISSYLETLNLEKLGVCHCSGLDAYAIFKRNLPNVSYYSSVGSRLLLS